MSAPLTDEVGRLARFLGDWGKPAALIGGLAIIARVRVRLTDDLDVFLVVPPGDQERLLPIASAHGYAWDQVEVDTLMPGGLVRLWGPPGVKQGVGVDVLFVDSPFAESVIRRSTVLDVLGYPLPVATVEDLLLMKLDANRPADWDDILTIKDGFADKLDRVYLDTFADPMGLTDRLRALLD